MKPLGIKAYGSIPHLPGSRMGPGDHHCEVGQARIATQKTRDRNDRVWVQEKLDGSCVAVARIGDDLHALGRAGYLAQTSKYEQHQLFADWVRRHACKFAFLEDGERVVGEWLAMAHGTRYDLGSRDPFVAFDIMRGIERTPLEQFLTRVISSLSVPQGINQDAGPMTIEEAIEALGPSGYYGALDPVEGAVWRVERYRRKTDEHPIVDFLVKYVRPDKVDGKYFSDEEPVWNWRP